MTQRSLLASFLRARREALSPQEAGFTASTRRRTPGLRREEVAQLAGVSVTWYTWLEQARDITVSRQVLESLARTLRLTPAERRHLYTLAGAALPEEPPEPAGVDATLQALLEALEPNPAHVIDSRWDLLAYNRPYAALIGGLDDLPDPARNTIWLLFTRESMRKLLLDWRQETEGILGQFRAAAARHPQDPRTAALISALHQASPEFTAMWSQHAIQAFSPKTKRFDHPRAGRIDLSYTKLSVADDPSRHLVVFLPASPSDAEALTALQPSEEEAASEHAPGTPANPELTSDGP
ncbi:helix-turn-helix transcriptional regulator [Actinospica robiniae]|uniref:helix-turn-helix transcriptional regulator n=1 Tax=Actinospica robiniae TaxID=304901 RepID=UPI001B7FE41E|nr:helix-turn-helix transcriptional regulator [Actinospica robiniae]